MAAPAPPLRLSCQPTGARACAAACWRRRIIGSSTAGWPAWRGIRRGARAAARELAGSAASSRRCWCRSSIARGADAADDGARAAICVATPARSAFRAAGWKPTTRMSRPRRCARPARRSASTPAAIEPIGFLSDHVVQTGYRITPVVALLRPGFTLQPDGTEVAEVFELPLAFALAADNYRVGRRTHPRAGGRHLGAALRRAQHLGRDRRHPGESARGARRGARA